MKLCIVYGEGYYETTRRIICLFILRETTQESELALKNIEIIPVIDEKLIKTEIRNPHLITCPKA